MSKKEIELHPSENNQQSGDHLHANHAKFSKQCLLVLQILRSGVRLTSRSAMINYGIGHLARRIKDLRDYNGIEIGEEWEMDKDGKTTRNKAWFINVKTTRETKKSLTEWAERYVKAVPQEQPELFNDKK